MSTIIRRTMVRPPWTDAEGQAHPAVWRYDEPAVHDAAVDLALSYGFDLAALDDVIEAGLAAGQDQRFMLRPRWDLLQAYGTGGIDAAKPFAQTLQGLLREADLRPLAQAAEKNSEVQAKRRRGKPADGEDTDRNRRICRFHDRLNGEHNPTARTAVEFGVSRSTVQRVLRQSRTKP